MPDQLRQRSLSGFDDPPESGRDPSEPTPCPVAAEAGPEPDLAGRRVFLVDAHGLIFQVFHALPEMTGAHGQPVAAVFGFARDIFGLLQQQKPDYLFCAFDHPGKTFRHALFAPYKADRGEMPEALRPQIPAIQRWLEAMRIPVLQLAGYEADDILATVARQVEARGGECYLVTSDKDCRQLLSDRVRMLNVRRGDNRIFDVAALAAEWGIRPEQVVDFQALVGDAVDNVPGIPQIGPKRAGDLLRQYGTLEGILQHVGEVRSKAPRENLIRGSQQVLLNRQLVRLDDAVPIHVDWELGRVGPPDESAVRELFREFGIRSLAEKLTGLGSADGPAGWEARYATVATPEALAQLVDQMSRQACISLDTETTNVHPRWAELVGLSFCWTAGEAWYVPLRAPEGEPRLDLDVARELLRGVLENPTIRKVGQNLKYDLVVLRGVGIEVQGVAFDTMVASYLLDAGQGNHSLDELSRQYLGHAPIPISDLIGSGSQARRMDEVPVDQVTTYAAEDADVALRLMAILQPRLEQERLTGLFTELEIPLIDVLAAMEFRGIRIDTPRLAELSQEYGARLARLEEAIHQLAGRPFNVNSPRQLAAVLFQEQGLPVLKKTRTGPSTDVDVLEQLAVQHQLPARIIEYRQFAKLKGTYVDALPRMVHPETGRVHTSFNQVVAATGRLSSNEPNLQNIPIRTEAGREIRAAFVPGEPGWQLVSADYSQIELRVLAHFSGDRALCEAFARDEDIHARVASQVHGVPLSEVTAAMRRHAKAVNFGVIYGQSPFGLARALNIEQDEAARFIDAYFAQYPGVEAFMRHLLQECQRQGHVSTILGRRRRIDGVRDPARQGDARQRSLAERTAINTVIQGSAADLIKVAMLRVQRRIRREQLTAPLLLQIHDELLFEAPARHVAHLASLVREEMSAAAQLAVPLKVDVKSGPNWADCQPLD